MSKPVDAQLDEGGDIQNLYGGTIVHSKGDVNLKRNVTNDPKLPHGGTVYVIQDAETNQVYRIGESGEGIWRNFEGFGGAYPDRQKMAGKRVRITHFEDEELSDPLFRDAVEASVLQGKSYPGNKSVNENLKRLREFKDGAKPEEIEQLDRIVDSIENLLNR